MPVQPEVSDIDSSARCPLLILIGSAIGWLVVGGGLALIASIQLHTPQFLAHCPFLTYGPHVQAAQETAFLYGWAINAGLAVSLLAPRAPRRRAATRSRSRRRRCDFLESSPSRLASWAFSRAI